MPGNVFIVGIAEFRRSSIFVAYHLDDGGFPGSGRTGDDENGGVAVGLVELMREILKKVFNAYHSRIKPACTNILHPSVDVFDSALGNDKLALWMEFSIPESSMDSYPFARFVNHVPSRKFVEFGINFIRFDIWTL